MVVGGEAGKQLELGRVEVGFFEAVGICGQCCRGAQGDHIVSDRGATLDHLDRLNGLFDRVDVQAATTVGNLGTIDVIQEDPFLLVVETRFGIVQVIAETNAAPIALLWAGARGMCVQTDVLGHPRGEIDAVCGSSQDLQRTTTAVGVEVGTADTDARLAQFKNGSRVDHHGDACGNFQCGAIAENLTGERTQANLVGEIVVQRGEITIRSGIGHYAHDVA